MASRFSRPLPGEPQRESRDDGLTVEGEVMEILPHDMFSIQLSSGQRIMGHIAGATRTRLVRVVPGDRVTVELSPYDLSRGRITQHLK